MFKESNNQPDHFNINLSDAMKTSFKAIALAAVFSTAFAFNTFADQKDTKVTGFATGIFASKSGKIHINVDKYGNEKTTVVVADENGQKVYREVLGKSESQLRTTLNISDLPAGTYHIEISSKNNKEVKSFNVTDKKAEREISMK
jgi:hypothetical protein